ncbi:serine protease grass-like [Drosophila rhopaloa]|uniref:Serine protease easter-like n=1 Tax=Drosophila rhopaloa TaxID=1041015 RepID=A0A6P4E780_DRORH|nr:serine protease grass-like [Drosophila rhopaloa]
MNRSFATFSLAWAIFCLINSSDAGRAFEQLRQQDCGVLPNTTITQRLHSRIYGGKPSFLMTQPWMAFIYIPNNLETCRCGGSLISQRFVLTAAHCYEMCPKPSELRVRLGEFDLNSSTDCITFGYKRICAPPVEEFAIERWIIHEGFNVFTPGYDIALVRLDQIVVFKDHIRPICLPLTEDLQAYTSVIGNPYKAVGWGLTENGISSIILMEVEIDTDRCPNGEDSSFLCANGNDVDTCRGDSGGPLVMSRNYFGTSGNVQYGVTSSGHTECGAGRGASYMNVSSFMPWIIAKLEAFP